MSGRVCSLQYAAGRIELCAQAGCPFWETDRSGAAGCAIERLGIAFEATPKLADFLLRMRLELARFHSVDERPRSLFYRLAPLCPGARVTR